MPTDLSPEEDFPRRHSLPLQFSIYDVLLIIKLPASDAIPEWLDKAKFASVTRTQDELSIVCSELAVPHSLKENLQRWQCFKLQGTFNFLLTGVLLSFIQPLQQVPIFAISTANTDYVLVMEEYMGMAFQALQDAGHEVV